MRILISGSSGLIGSNLVTFLESKGHEVHRLVRPGSRPSENAISWNPAANMLDPENIEGFDALVNLAGENISSGRWTDELKARLRSSRLDSTKLLVDTMSSLSNPPSIFLCASAIGYYGDRGDEELTEDSSVGEGFLARLCKDWEDTANIASDKGVRVVNLRIGVVLSPEGGMLGKVLTPFKMGAGGIIGDGKQYLSWVTIDDIVQIIEHCLINEEISGPVNAVSPSPITNKQFTDALGKTLSRPTIFPIPAFGARIVFGEMADELMLTSNLIRPTKLEKSNYEFRHAAIEPALRALLS